MTFQEILLAEPRLIDLMNDGYKFASIEPVEWKRSLYWYKMLKPRFIELVGFQARNRKLKDCETYDLVYRFFIDLMEM